MIRRCGSGKHCLQLLHQGIRRALTDSTAQCGMIARETQQDAKLPRLFMQQQRWQHGYRDNRCWDDDSAAST